MIKIDLITGFLGAGKTTFLKQYVSWLNANGKKVGIIENDFGAINVDALLLQELQSDLCDVEQIVGGNEVTDWKRRFRAKLIAMAMQGFERIVVEPSGIYDVDAFFDVLYEEPLDRWYEAGTVFAIVDGDLEKNLVDAEQYLMVSQIANASRILLSKTKELPKENVRQTIKNLQIMMQKFHCDRNISNEVITKSWDCFSDEDFCDFLKAGWVRADHEKLWFDKKEIFDTLFFMGDTFPKKDRLQTKIQQLFETTACGEIARVKGFYLMEDNSWRMLNATRENFEEATGRYGQEVIIIIGKNLNETAIKEILQ